MCINLFKFHILFYLQVYFVYNFFYLILILFTCKTIGTKGIHMGDIGVYT